MRNFDFRTAVRSAVFAAALLGVVQSGPSSAQIEPIANTPKENTSAKSASEETKPKTETEPSDPFQQLLDRAIDVTSKRTLTANAHSPWQIFHCILAMRTESVLKLEKGKGNEKVYEKVNAIDWLSTAEPEFDKQPWLLLTPHGAKFHPYTKMYFFEGHPSQFLALLSHSNLPTTTPFHVQGKVVTLQDIVNNTMQEVNTKEEVTWVLWALQHFLEPDATWQNQAKEKWSIERLVQIEAASPVVGAPCNGNHRLFALTKARDKYLKNGGQLRGAWFDADQKVKRHIELARTLQNSDGSFSSEGYKGAGWTGDVNKRFNTSGHTMEFLAAALPNERLSEPWVRNAVWMLSRELIIHQNTQIDCGPLFHTLDSLILYRDRIRAKAPAIPKSTPSLDQPPLITIDPPPTTSSVTAKSKDDSKVPSLSSSPDSKVLTLPPKIAASTEEKKVSAPANQPVPTPAPEPMPVPELKVPELKFEPPKLIDPQTQLLKPGMLKPKAPVSKAVPKIDPSLLSDVGEVSPTAKLNDKTVESGPAQGLRPAAPALLPAESATPLVDSASPADSKIPLPGPEVVTPEDCGKSKPPAGPFDEETFETEVDAEEALPASALQPANAQ